MSTPRERRHRSHEVAGGKDVTIKFCGPGEAPLAVQHLDASRFVAGTPAALVAPAPAAPQLLVIIGARDGAQGAVGQVNNGLGVKSKHELPDQRPGTSRVSESSPSDSATTSEDESGSPEPNSTSRASSAPDSWPGSTPSVAGGPLALNINSDNGPDSGINDNLRVVLDDEARFRPDALPGHRRESA